MAQKSILIINRVYPPHYGATGRMASDLAKHLAAQGWDVQVLATGEKSARYEDQGVHVRTIKAKPLRRSWMGYCLVWIRLFLAALGAKKTSVVITLTDPPLLIFVGAIVAKLKRAKHVHWCHDVYPDLLPLFGVRLPRFVMRALHKASRRRMSKCAQIVAIGRCMSKRLAMTGVEQSNIRIIPNWSDPNIFTPADHTLPLMKPKAQMPENMFRDDSPKFRILYAGNIGKAHEVDMFLKAAEALHDHKEIEFVFVGTSEGHDRLADERAKMGLDNMKFMPYQPAPYLRTILESGDLHLVSMKDDMAGLLVPCKFYAALAVGRPTLFLGPQKSEIGKVIETYKAGKIVSVHSADKLVKGILEYRHDGSAWFAAQQGAIEAGKLYNPPASFALWDETLKSVMKL
ncbi:MAG: glycosyltransferase family 4 protein [Alphaproteobacteria bacterium]|nr:glycosyltransferase family 4 protein [Alphaproteobacteria bacterium]NCQ89244.1 glycosyltransferase family 4 protein [Alphaproteobacteria bacterium]NCT08383.1 glycosyltransferase family 4 protein [Alphaproteobacteria bacterium]